MPLVAQEPRPPSRIWDPIPEHSSSDDDAVLILKDGVTVSSLPSPGSGRQSLGNPWVWWGWSPAVIPSSLSGRAGGPQASLHPLQPLREVGLPTPSPVGSSGHPSLGTSGGTASVPRLRGAVSPTPIFPIPGPGKHRASELLRPIPVLNPNSRPDPIPIRPGSNRARSPHLHLGATAQLRRGARAAGCGDRPHAPTWEELPAGPPPPRWLCGPSTTWQGTVSKFPSAPLREQLLSAAASRGPSPRLLRPVGEPG